MTTAVATLAARTPGWLAGDGDGIAISARVRLARNVADKPFRRTMTRAQQQELVDLLLAAGAALPWPGALALRLDGMPAAERQALMERQLASRELAGVEHPAGVIAAADEGAALMVNEEDHVRLQTIAPGLDLDGCLTRAVAADQALEGLVPWAFHPRYGYLTACHTNTGTGMRASVMLHLPALHETGELKAVLRALAKLNLTVRGAHGEGSEARGHRYQLSNLRALGVDEPTIAATVAEAAQQVVAAERLARQALLEKQRTTTEDRIWRAWALLAHARTLTSEEFDEQWSWVRLGSALRVLNHDHTPTWRDLDRLALHAQPAHLQLRFPDADDSAVRDRRRAETVRDELKIDD